MRQTILGFNQEQALELKLSVNDLLLLQYIMYANGEPTMLHIVENDMAYVWLSHQKIQEDLPILNITEGTLKNKLNELKSKRLIDSKTFSNNSGKGSRTYYTITITTLNLLNTIPNKPSKNDMQIQAGHSEMASNNMLNNNINNIILSNKLDNITISNEIDQKNLTDFFIDGVSNKYYKDSINTIDKKSKKSVDPENSKKFQNLVEFINTLNYNETTKEILLKWYTNVGVGKISIKQLKDKITKLYESVKTETEACESFNNSYINSWLAFYPPKKYKTYNNTDNYLYQESKQVTEDMYIKNTDGTFKEY